MTPSSPPLHSTAQSMTLQEIATALNVDPVAIPPARIGGVSTDTRTLAPASLFVAIRGDRFDGHAFVDQAVRARACGAVIEDLASIRDVPAEFPLLRVADTRAALGAIARLCRRRSSAQVIAITGSNGKTTTKTFTAQLFSPFGSVCASPKSFNNDIGVPLTLFSAPADARWVILEMGTNHFGELANLCAIAEPEIAAITNIGKAHLEVFRDLDGVARAKSELIEPLPQEGIAVLNADDSRYPYLRSRTRARVVTFGLDGPRADVRGSDVCRSSDGFEFLVNGRYRAELRVPGEYNVRNVLAAMALGYASGLPLADLAEGVRSLELPDLRMQVIPAGEVRVVLDAYNANPSSMEAALAEFAQWRVSGRKVVLLGDMLELGELSREWHRDLGRKVLTMAPDVVITVGEAMIDLQAVLSESGFPNGRRHHFLRTAEAEEAVPGLLLPGDTLFIKGSRAMGLEVLARSLSGAWDKEKGQ